MQTVEPGLRQRQRLETLRSLHLAASELAEEGGLAAATVDAIADRAGVSRRTFFNYFASKEDAILGLIPPRVPDEVPEPSSEQAAGTDDLRRAVHLLAVTARSSRMTEGGYARRRELVDRFPEFNHRLKRQAQEIQELVLDQLTVNDSRLGERVEGRLDRARALVLMAASIMRFAYESDPRILEEENLSAFDHSTSVFRSLLKEVR
ncbi:TetR/AcrR family transcriptional regulator [Brachybacterium tyrofermentans]|uniref:TetR/AcrR family transcriptional regulator n=1 Tax=Brachybacterium tyrofermentans TaxID=47848 RepID=A0ABW0FN34_9MICO|nr:Transcriptional regulator, TetR family [Corynebacterium xerosis]